MKNPTELDNFLAMLTRAGIGHGKRVDYNPEGIGIQVECENGNVSTDWRFDSKGILREVLGSNYD